MFNTLKAAVCVAGFGYFLAVVGGISGCDFPRSQEQTPKKVVAPHPITQAQRIAEATRILSRLNKLPSPLLDAHVDERPLYDDMGWGPTDSTLYMYVKIAPKEMEKWDPVLGEKGEWGPVAPKDQPYTWWFEPERFRTFEYYDPWILLKLQGWVVVSRKTGEIWIVGSKT